MTAQFTMPRYASRGSGIAGALVLALLFSFVGNIEYVLPPLRVGFDAPSPVTLRLSSDVYLQSTMVKDSYVERWFPVRVGERIRSEDRYRFVRAFTKHKTDNIVRRVAGFFAVMALLGLIFSQSIRTNWPGQRRELRTELSCYLLMLIAMVGTKAFLAFTFLPYTLLPLTSITVISAFFLGRRLGLMMCIIVSVMASLMLDADLVALLFFVVQGLTVLPVVKHYRRKRRFLATSLMATLPGLVVLAALTFMLTSATDAATVTNWRNSLLLSAVGGGVLAYPLTWFLYPVIRPLLGIVSQGKLNELQELQHPLLKKLQQNAPATWEHSRAIANLAEEAASKIGADALLVRVGAYFHDIGKAAAPEYFVENYAVNGSAGEGPHSRIAPEKSAELIIDHVVEGVKILRSNAIPETVVEFVYMHHGTTPVEFFWRKYCERAREMPEEEKLPRSHFVYPGRKPQSPEHAILMLADGVEAASRTLSDHGVEEIQKVVSHVVIGKLLDGQLDDSGLTAENLRTVLKSLVDSLHFSHHTRIKYQWQETKPPAPAHAPAPPAAAAANEAPPVPPAAAHAPRISPIPTPVPEPPAAPPAEPPAAAREAPPAVDHLPVTPPEETAPPAVQWVIEKDKDVVQQKVQHEMPGESEPTDIKVRQSIVSLLSSGDDGLPSHPAPAAQPPAPAHEAAPAAANSAGPTPEPKKEP